MWKKFTSFCQALKRCTQKKTGSFLLPHGVFFDVNRTVSARDGRGGHLLQFSRRQSLRGARAHNGCLGRSPSPAGSRGTAPGQGVNGQSPSEAESILRSNRWSEFAPFPVLCKLLKAKTGYSWKTVKLLTFLVSFYIILLDMRPFSNYLILVADHLCYVERRSLNSNSWPDLI